MRRHTRTKLLVVLAAALSLSALLLTGGASAQRAARPANDNATGGAKSKRVVGVRSSNTGNGSRVTITADDSLKDYSAYRSGDRFYVVLPKAAAGARGGGAGKGYTDMQVQQRGDSVVLSYRVQPGAKPRVEQKFNRLDVVFDVPGDAAQQAATNNAARPQPQQQTPPAENRNPAGQQNNRTQAATNAPKPNPTPERRQATAEEAARAQAANAAAANTTAPVATSIQPTATVEPVAQNPASSSVEPTQEPAPAATPAAEPQVAQAQAPAAIAPITTDQPAAATQSGTSLGTFLIRNWAPIVVVTLVVVGLGLVIAARRTAAAAPAPVEGLGNDSSADVKPLAAAIALAGGAAVAKSKKQSRKEARQEARRKKQGARTEELASEAEPAAAESAFAAPDAQGSMVEEPAVEEQFVAAPVAEETAAVEQVAEETAVHEQAVIEAHSVEESAQEEPDEVAQAVTTEEAAEVVAEPGVAERFTAPAVETAEPEQFEGAEAGVEPPPALDTPEVAPAETEAAGAFVAEAEAPAPATEIEPAFETEPDFVPDPERVLAETRHLLEGEEYDRVVVGSRDAMARQMVAAELLSALAGRNARRRERASAAFVEHGYFDETARDLREADAPAERSAAARSLAILGDRHVTPLLVAALEDPVPDVRRAAVEALGALRDPSAVGPLEALLEREKGERSRIPPRVIRTAVEFCREGFAQTPAAETEVAPAEEAAVETAPEHFADDSAPGAAHEPSVSIEPFIEPGRPSLDFAEETAGAPEEFAAPAAEEVGIEPVAGQGEGFSTAGTFDLRKGEQESGQAALLEASADEATREIEPAAADPSEGSNPPVGAAAACEWFDFDISEVGGEEQPAAEATAAPEPAPASPVFETSSGETLTAPTADAVEEAAPFAEAPASATREIEVADDTADARSFLREPEPAAGTREKGVAPFDELSTVPASIQQRLASRNANERAAAIIELSHVDTDEAFQQICASFDDGSEEVRSAAARALHELRADRAESFTRALREATPERRREIGAAIASSGLAAESISQLTGESRERTYEAFSLLFLMAKAGEVQLLLRAIEGHPHNEVRLAVVKLLALSGQKEVLPAFRRLAVRGSLPTEVRSAVMEAIYQISSSQPAHA